MQTHFVYIGTFIIACLLARAAEYTNNKKFVWGVIIVLSLVSGLRNETVGIDTYNYINAFKNIINGRLELAYGIEWSFRYICYALSFVFKDAQLFLALFSVSSITLIVLRLYEMRNWISFTWSIVIYYSIFFMMSMNLTRQFVAVAIVFYATKYIQQGKNIKFLSCVFVAALIHQTAIIGLVYFFFNILLWGVLGKKQKCVTIFFVAVAPVVMVYAGNILDSYTKYFETVTWDVGIFLFVKFAVLFGSLFFLDFTEEDEFGETTVLKKFTVIAYALGLLLTFLGYMFKFVDRIGLYFYIFEAVYVGYIFKQKNTKNNLMLKMLICAVFTVVFMGAVFGNGQGQAPYLFFWQ